MLLINRSAGARGWPRKAWTWRPRSTATRWAQPPLISARVSWGDLFFGLNFRNQRSVGLAYCDSDEWAGSRISVVFLVQWWTEVAVLRLG